jgi:hypothetical protein
MFCRSHLSWRNEKALLHSNKPPKDADWTVILPQVKALVDSGIHPDVIYMKVSNSDENPPPVFSWWSGSSGAVYHSLVMDVTDQLIEMGLSGPCIIPKLLQTCAFPAYCEWLDLFLVNNSTVMSAALTPTDIRFARYFYERSPSLPPLLFPASFWQCLSKSREEDWYAAWVLRSMGYLGVRESFSEKDFSAPPPPVWWKDNLETGRVKRIKEKGMVRTTLYEYLPAVLVSIVQEYDDT